MAVQRAVRRALTDAAPIPNIAPIVPTVTPRQIDERQRMIDSGHSAMSLIPPAERGESTPDQPRPAAETLPLPVASQPPPAPFLPTVGVPMLRVIGQIASTYIIAEGPDGLYLVDQHAAHERVLYEQLMAEHTRQSPGQELLEPLVVNLAPAQWAAYNEQRATFEHVGFRLEAFGGQALMLRAVPAILKNREPRAMLVQVLDELSEGEAPLAQDAEARLITSICKGAAVKGGQTLSLEEMRALIRDLEKTTSPRTCPHGRPTMIQLNLANLEREFGRRG